MSLRRGRSSRRPAQLSASGGAAQQDGDLVPVVVKLPDEDGFVTIRV